MVFELYQMYSRKSIKKNIIFKYACVFSVILAVAIMLFMQIILDSYQNTLSERIRLMNGADVKILDKGYLEHIFTEKELKIIENTIGKDNYTLAYCNNSNLIADGKEDTVAMTVFNRSDLVLEFGIKHLNIGEIVVSSSVAKRLNISVGDDIYIKLYSNNYSDRKFKVVQILNDNIYFSVAGNEYEIAQETLGCVYVMLPKYDTFNTAYFQGIDTKKINLLKEKIGASFEIRTIKELTNIVVPRIQIQVAILKLISNLVMLISSICLVWSFLIFILDRKDDFLIFKKIGMRTIDLSKLVLLEIYAMVIKGIIGGIPFGVLMAVGYLQKNGGIDGLTVFSVLKNILVIILFILFESAVFSLIPIFKIKKIMDCNNLSSSTSIPIGIILVVIINMMIISCIYVKSYTGIVFFISIGIIFGIFYLIMNGLTQIALKIISFSKDRSFLLIADMKSEGKITYFSLNIINICLVILSILLSVLPMLYSPIEEGTNIGTENISYSSLRENTNVEKLLKERNVIYEKYYTSKIKIIQVNGIDVDDCINPNIADMYKQESIMEVSNRKIEIYEDEHTFNKFNIQNGIYINNIYKNVIDFKEGDLLTISFNDTTVQCKIAGTYEDASNKDAVGISLESYMKLQGIDTIERQMPITYILGEHIDNDILNTILYEDKTAYIERSQQLSNYFKEYIDKQKVILINNIIAVGFASVLLVLLGQMILFIKKKDYYTALWKIGMSKRYLINSLLVEKAILTMIQIIVVNIFLEPIRFLISAEVSQGKYSISGRILLIEFGIICSINLTSIIFPFVLRKRKNNEGK